MKYYGLEYKIGSEECSILWETESDSLSGAMGLIKPEIGFEYEVVSEVDIMNEINKYYDVEAETFLH